MPRFGRMRSSETARPPRRGGAVATPHLRRHAQDARGDGPAGVRDHRHRFEGTNLRSTLQDEPGPGVVGRDRSGKGAAERHSRTGRRRGGRLSPAGGPALHHRRRMRGATRHTGGKPIRIVEICRVLNLPAFFIPGLSSGLPSSTKVGAVCAKVRLHGSVRGAARKGGSYRDRYIY